MNARERRHQRLAEAVRKAMVELAGVYQQPNRQDWAASRMREGWSPSIVKDAIGAGALARVREKIRESDGAAPDMPAHLARAMRALAVIDEQRLAATRRGANLKPHRGAGLPPRLHDSPPISRS